MKIDDFYLTENVRSAILSYSANGTFPQTILVEGGSMQTRTDFARLLANMIVCTGEGDKPCGKCPACIKCAAGSHPDIKEYGEEKEKYTFKVEMSREIRSDAFVIPNDSDKKVYIIKEAQNMNDSSENALLKIFEEPPHFDHFIMTCPSRSAMLDTVLSRSALISLGYNEESYDAETQKLTGEIISALCSENELRLLEALAPLSADKERFLPVIGCLRRNLLEALKLKTGAPFNSDYREAVSALSGKFPQNKLYSYITVLSELESDFRANANYNLLITYMSVKLKNC